jgi:hypothetical protein
VTQYTRNDLDREARRAARDIRKETGQPAKVHHWILYLDGTNATLAVIVNAYDGVRQRNVAI